MKTIKHWLHGECKFEELVDKETDCSTCIHIRVCKFDVSDFCINHIFSCSAKDMARCETCIHKFTRYDNRQPIPCFKCKFYKEEYENS